MEINPDSDLISEHRDDKVVTLTLGAAPAHPLSLAMIKTLHAALVRAGEDDSVGAIVIHGPGRIFCAGHDLKEIARHRREEDHGQAFLQQLFTACSDMMLTLARSPKPTIAMVEGLATAAGLQMVATCDLAYAAPGARFCLPGVKNHGFCTTPSVAVSRSVSPKHLMELALTGEPVDAEWALAAGLINRILPDNDLAPFVRDMAAKVAGHNRKAVADGKRAAFQQMAMPLDQAYAHATEVMVGHFMDPERIAIEKRRWGET